MKNIHVKYNPKTEMWEVLELEDWESYYDDVEKYGEEVAQYNWGILKEGEHETRRSQLSPFENQWYTKTVA